jgi:lysyl-tRNA synthetase, class I
MLQQFKVQKQDEVRVSAEALNKTVQQIFESLGVPSDQAAEGAHVLTMTDLRGVDSHGVSNMLRNYVEAFMNGRLNPDPKWKILRVTVEAAGKDLSTAGGSRDRAETLAREVFGFEPPRNFPYEFVLTGGRKMKSSAGTGTPAHAVVDILPPELVRFLMLRYRPQATIEFDPAGETIPRLFDEYDSYVAEAVAGPADGTDPDEAAHRRRIVEMSQLPGRELPRHFLAPFVQVATYAQMPGATPERIAEQIARHRGAELDEFEVSVVRERLATVQRWLPDLAPERLRFSVALDVLPSAAASLDKGQSAYLDALAERIADHGWEGEALQSTIFGLAQERGLPAGRAFAAIYAAFLGKPHGPRAGALLASLDRSFVVERLHAAAAGVPVR